MVPDAVEVGGFGCFGALGDFMRLIPHDLEALKCCFCVSYSWVSNSTLWLLHLSPRIPNLAPTQSLSKSLWSLRVINYYSNGGGLKRLGVITLS